MRLSTLIFTMLCLLLSQAASATETGTLTVFIDDVDHRAGGTLRIALFNSSGGWPKFSNAYRTALLKPAEKQLLAVFEDLPYADDYAVEIHHDENGNDKFDMRWLPYPRPKEGVGVSNNRKSFGHPDFSDARFPLSTAAKSIRIQMRY